MKRAWEYNLELIQGAVPKVLSEDEQTWTDAFETDKTEFEKIRLLWWDNVPGSFAPERVIVGGILSMYNMGYDVTEAEALIPKGIAAFERGDKVELTKLTSQIWHILNTARKVEGHAYWTYKRYETFDDYLESVAFPGPVPVADFADRIYGGWLAQVVGGALGTAVEGYCTKQIRAAFGEVRGYVRPPNTYNDDITYELAFLEAFKVHGYDVTARDIALEWVGRIPSGWSAEMVALNNLRFGVFPPESGRLHNPFREWIGAQMRGAVCGLVAPGDPKMAARLAWIDGSISHDNNGIIGEVFNAMLVSLAFVEREVKDLVKRAIDLVPKDSEYYQAVSFAYEHCVKSNNWEDAWGPCETKFKEYNWIHAYPNAAAEVVAIYFSNNSFDECMHIIAMEGQDVDCNAAQIGTIYGVMFGSQHISKEWADPIGDRVVSYMRGFEVTSISEIGKTTSDAVVKARKTIE